MDGKELTIAKNKLAIGHTVAELASKPNDGSIYDTGEWDNVWIMKLDNGLKIVGACNPEQPELKCEDECKNLIGLEIVELNEMGDFVFENAEVFFGEVVDVYVIDRQETIELLSESEFEGMSDSSLRQVLLDGTLGWNNFTDDEIADCWHSIYAPNHDWFVAVVNGDSTKQRLTDEAKEFIIEEIQRIDCFNCPLDCPRMKSDDDEAQCYIETAINILDGK